MDHIEKQRQNYEACKQGWLVEKLAGVSKTPIEQHEQAAQVAFAGVLIVGVAALGGLIFFRRDKAIPNWLAIIVLVLSAIVFALMVRTPSLGGLIRHTGIRADVHAAMINDEKPD